MFERFTDRARRVVILAQEEARIQNRDHIGTEHVLVGLILDGEGVAAKVLDVLGISMEAVRAKVKEIIGDDQQPSPAGHIPFTPRAKKVTLELSLQEALQLKHSYIGTEHILLALISEREGVAAQVLVHLGVDLVQARGCVLEMLDVHDVEDQVIPDVTEHEQSQDPLPDDLPLPETREDLFEELNWILVRAAQIVARLAS